MTDIYFAKHLAFITAVTEALNNLPTLDGYYLHVELRHEGSHEVSGKWCDEIAPSDWYFAPEADGAA